MEVFGYDPAKDELPIKYLCEVMFPVSDLPKFLIPVAEIMPLTHTVRITRALCSSSLSWTCLWDIAYSVLFVLIIGHLAIFKLKKRLING